MVVLVYFKHSFLTSALSQKSIYSALFLTPEDVPFVMLADDLAYNAVERFAPCVVNCDNKFRGVGSSDDGVDTRPRNAASGVTTSGTSGNSAADVPRAE